jgi:septal ring factor EnvC (AmiA/AmiB activator)
MSASNDSEREDFEKFKVLWNGTCTVQSFQNMRAAYPGVEVIDLVPFFALSVAKGLMARNVAKTLALATKSSSEELSRKESVIDASNEEISKLKHLLNETSGKLAKADSSLKKFKQTSAEVFNTEDDFQSRIVMTSTQYGGSVSPLNLREFSPLSEHGYSVVSETEAIP